MNSWARAATGVVAAGAATVVYAAGIERRHWTLREATLPVLPPGTARHQGPAPLGPAHDPRPALQAALGRALAELEPDLVVDTGDNLAHARAVPAVLAALDPLLSLPGRFVWGSNDYFGPTFKNPARYLVPAWQKRVHGDALPWRDLRGGADRARLAGRHPHPIHGRRRRRQIAFAGVDDPHIKHDRYDLVAGRPTPTPRSSSA